MPTGEELELKEDALTDQEGNKMRQVADRRPMRQKGRNTTRADNPTGKEKYSGTPQSDGRAENRQRVTERAYYTIADGQTVIDLTDNMVKLADDDKASTKRCTEINDGNNWGARTSR